MELAELLPSFLSTLFSASIGFLVWRIERRHEKQYRRQEEEARRLEHERQEDERIRLADRKGTECLLRDRLIQGVRFCLKQGYAEIEDRTNFIEMYQAYHDLGGNGVVTNLMKEFSELPFQKPKRVSTK